MVKTIKSRVEVKELGKYFIINPINAQGNSDSYLFCKDLTKPMNLENELPEFYEQEKKAGNPTPANSIQIYDVMKHAVISKSSSLINHLHNTFRGNYLRALSVAVNSSVSDENGVLHNYNTSDEFIKRGMVWGQDGNINDLTLKQRNPLELIFGEKRKPVLNKISQTINQTPFYFWRPNSKPFKKIKTGLDFDAYSDGFGINAGWSLSYQSPAIRVLREK